MYDEYVEAGHHDIPRDIVDAVLKRPLRCGLVYLTLPFSIFVRSLGVRMNFIKL